MSANVRCAGLPSLINPGKGLPSCGWKGERFPSVPMTTMPQIAKVDFERKATAKPCPRCGGKVELIPTSP